MNPLKEPVNLLGGPLLGGPWDLKIRVINKVAIVIYYIHLMTIATLPATPITNPMTL